MTAISDMVVVTVTETTAGLIQTGFGTALYLSAAATWPERIRFYSSLAGIAADWATTTPEYKAGNRNFSQSPHPPLFAIGRLANKPTQKRTLTPVVFNLAVYSVRVGATTVSFTSDGTATAAEIVTGLIALINAIPGVTLTATGTTTLVLTENAAGTWSDVQIDPTYFTLVQDHADPGVTADLTAIQVEDDSWYCILNSFSSKPMNLAIAAFAEANAKLFICQSQDTDIINTVLSGATDVAASMQTLAYKNSAATYHPNPGSFIAVGWSARRLPQTPGSETWAFTRDIAGVEAVKLTATQRANLLNKNCNIYEKVAGVNVFSTRSDGKGGTTASGRFIDITRGIAWLVARVGERLFLANANAPTKLGLDDEGIATQAGQLESVMIEGRTNKFFRSYQMGPIPKADDIPDADRAVRHLAGLSAIGFLAGAGHTAAVLINVAP